MKIAIDLVVTKPASSPRSHKTAWLHLWANQLKHHLKEEVEVLTIAQDWDNFDKVFLNHGMELKGESINLFGGAGDEPAEKLRRLIGINPNKFISIDVPMVDYGEFGKRRMLGSGCSELWKSTNWDSISDVCKKIPMMTQADLKTEHLLLGDSHSFSMYKPGMMVSRNDGKTLHGAMKIGLKNMILPFGPQVKHLTLYFGNIDIRHHLCRLETSYEKNVMELLNLYREELKKIKDDYDSIELISVLPIENISRRIPKSTGYYKGQPFWGSWKDRTSASELFNDILYDIASDLNLKIYSHPKEILNDDGELSFYSMESPKNVHLGRPFFRWDLENDILNKLIPKKSISNLISF